MARRRSRADLALVITAALALGAAAITAPSAPIAAQERRLGGGYAFDDPEWRFTLSQRRVKVVVLAGSIGAFQDEPYARLIHEWCANTEVRNLSRVGFGAWQLFERFHEQVLGNPRMPFGSDGVEMWLLWNGGLNSAAASQRTNHYIRRVFRDAHRRGMRVVGMSLTPWGSFGAGSRWEGARGLDTFRSTRRIVDFVMARIGPREALGAHVAHRGVAPDSPWTVAERADVRIDLFDSALRDRDAPVRELAEMRALLERDARWRRAHESLDPAAHAARLEADASTLAELPRWFLRRAYRGFDPVHPNRAGHRAIAEIACPQLPSSWSCTCPGTRSAP